MAWRASGILEEGTQRAWRLGLDLEGLGFRGLEVWVFGLTG